MFDELKNWAGSQGTIMCGLRVSVIANILLFHLL